MDTNMDKYLGTTLDDRYEIQEIIGTGGMAVVYKATDNRLHRSVAVKILRDELAADEEFRRRFQTEAQAVAMLSHPNIVSVYDVSHSESVEYIVMELIEGVTLMQYMQKKGALGWKEALHFSVQISKALEHAHSKGIVHRDIKPQNIMILATADKGRRLRHSRAREHAGAAQQPDRRLRPLHRARAGPRRAAGHPQRHILPRRRHVRDAHRAHALRRRDRRADCPQAHRGVAVPPQEINPEIPDELARITLKAMNADINAATSRPPSCSPTSRSSASSRPPRRTRRRGGGLRGSPTSTP